MASFQEQNKKILDASDPEDYADSFTRESLNLFDDVLKRQESWIGIPEEQKKAQVCDRQTNKWAL